MAKVSLIMLVYKTEPFIEKSFRSALEQTFEDLEVVIVNDATPDGAMAVVEKVLREYPNRQSQVKIINHLVNSGSAVARQTGIDNATGEYTIFLDSDDWAEPQMCERLYAKAKQDDADIVVCDFYVESPKKLKYHSQPSPSTGKELFKALMRGNLAPAVWNKMVRRSLYSRHDVEFIPNINTGEDVLISIKLSWFADKVSYFPEAFVHYRTDNPLSYTNADVFDRKRIDDTLRLASEFERFVKDIPDCRYYTDDIIFRKLINRGMLIRITRGREQRSMIAIYPEIPRSYILKQPNVIIPYRIAHYLASSGLFRVANIIYRAGHIVKTITGRTI